MIIKVAMGIMAGALLWLDRVYAFQLMVSRPMIMSPLIGALMGNLTVGLAVGAALELLWLNAPPVGAYLPKDESFCAAAVTPAAVLAASWLPEAPAAGLALFAGLPLSLAGRSLDAHIRNLNQNLVTVSPAVAERTVGQAMAKALGRSFLYGLLALAAGTGALCAVVVVAAPRLPAPALTALSYMPSASVAIGLAGLVSNDISRPAKAGLFVLGMVMLLLLSWIR
jgi:mannose/fructose/N-acetylgalactosamine-specific phosphotransferase system component IIC